MDHVYGCYCTVTIRVLLLPLLIRLSRNMHTDSTVKTFIIRLQGLSGMSKSSQHVCFGMRTLFEISDNNNDLDVDLIFRDVGY